MPSRLSTTNVLGSPIRNLVSILAFMGVVIVCATIAYMRAGWSFADASYMVALTVYTVGYGEVRPIDTPYLHAVTMSLMVLGCTGMILLTSALVQLFTVVQLREVFGAGRMKDRISRLSGHVIICGYGRIGQMLAQDLSAANAPMLILEQNANRLAEAEGAGYLALAGDATDEEALEIAGIARAGTLATVLPNDAANVFITLSARKLNAELRIIARGEAPTTEGKLRQAGADHVVLPTHIGAERIARLILYPESSAIEVDEELEQSAKDLGKLGLDLERVIVAERSGMAGLTITEAERRGGGQFFIVGLSQHGTGPMAKPGRDQRLAANDRVLVVARPGAAAALSLFSTKTAVKVGRNTY